MIADILTSLTLASTDASSGGKGAFFGITCVCLMGAVPLLALLGFLVTGLSAFLGVKNKLPAYFSVACLALSFVVTLMALLSWPAAGAHGTESHQVVKLFEWITFDYAGGADGKAITTFTANFSFYIDTLTLLWMLFVTGLATLIALYASEYMAADVGMGYCRFFAAFNLFVFSMACLVMGDNLVLLYLGWEGVGLCSYLLIGYFYKKPSAVAAAKKAFIMNRIGDLGLALGIMLTYVHFGSVEYTVIFEKAQVYFQMLQLGRGEDIPLHVQFIPILLMIGAFGKSAQLPLFVWLPDAMEGPTPVSALIHAATMVTAGVYLIARTYPLFLLSEYALPIVGIVGALTALVAATIGMAQFDIKRIMAYSTVSQLGYMFAGLGVLSSTGAAFHVFTHAFFKAMLFLSCGAVMHGFAGQLDLRKLSGVAFMKGWGIVGIAMFVGCLNLAGFPLTAGFFSKDMILAEAFTTPGGQVIGWILLVTAGLTAYYTFRVFFRVFVGPKYFEPGDEVHGHDDHGHGHDEHAHGHEGKGEGKEHGEDAHATGANHGHDAHATFHPHAPGWAINTVLATLTVACIAVAALYFSGPKGTHGGWVGSMVGSSSASYHTPFHFEGHSESAAKPASADHAKADPVPNGLNVENMISLAETNKNMAAGSFLGFDPHAAMYYVSAVVGLSGILVAFFLHYLGRTTAATSRADALLPAFGAVARGAQHKWYVDEIYDFLIRKPLWVLSNIFHLIDKLVVDGIVNLVGLLPRALGGTIRPSQSGVLHGYAAGMAGGLALLLLIALWVSFA